MTETTLSKEKGENLTRSDNVLNSSTRTTAYTVFPDGAWCENWEAANWNKPHDIRPATSEEAALMDKVVWGTASWSEARKLREMLNG